MQMFVFIAIVQWICMEPQKAQFKKKIIRQSEYVSVQIKQFFS